VNYEDKLSHTHDYFSYASNQPAVHSMLEGYYLADRLPLKFYTDQIVDSKELDAAASLKYSWNRTWNNVQSRFKAGAQWKANGNAGQGEYYQDKTVAANGYRPRPYSDYPYMHNLSFYLEEDLTIPIGRTKLDITAGIRMENVYIRGSEYTDTRTFSPRLNAKWKLGEVVSTRGGWGITEKLPSFNILYPKQEYRDIQTFAFSHSDGATSSYVYYTQPYTVLYNPQLKWQRNSNSELGLDITKGEFSFSLVAFRNKTKLPYKLSTLYSPFSYNILKTPAGFEMPSDPQIRVDSQTGDVYLRDANDYWTAMDVKVTDRTFVKNTMQDNGADIDRTGLELTVDFPKINVLMTSFRLDASYVHTETEDRSLSYYYNTGWSHTSLPNRSYQYVGIYANGGNSSMLVAGRTSNTLTANITSITHIPQARLIVTCRLEMSLLNRFRNIPAGDTDKILPVQYMDEYGQIHNFTKEMANDPEYSHLVLKAGNDYLFDQDGYGPYASANLSITKEIGKRVSLSFFANNFTNSRPTVYSMATGVGAVFTPSFYYGLSCRLKL